MKSIPQKILITLASLGCLALASQADIVTWVGNDGGAGGDGVTFYDADNWDTDGVPVGGDTVLINSGASVNIQNGLPTGGVSLSLSNSSTLNHIGVDGEFQFNMRGSIITIDGTSSVTGTGEFFRVYSGEGFVFDDGAALSGITTMELNDGGGSFTFNLGAGGFTTVNAGNTLGVNGTLATAIDASDFVVDFDNYTGGAGAFTLIGWNSAPGALDDAMLQTANISFENASGYSASLTWDDPNNAIVLGVTAVPEPASLALLLAGGGMLFGLRKWLWSC